MIGWPPVEALSGAQGNIAGRARPRGFVVAYDFG
jgi:hypothetical protein